jgi:hypothetical protein
MADFIEPEGGAKKEMVSKSTKRCCTSCAECLEEFGVSALGSLIGPIYANKRVLDDLVKSVMAKRPEVFRKRGSDLDDLAEAIADIGETTSGSLELRDNQGNPFILRSILQSEHLWAEVDLDDPVDGRSVKEQLWVRMFDSGWD